MGGPARDCRPSLGGELSSLDCSTEVLTQFLLAIQTRLAENLRNAREKIPRSLPFSETIFLQLYMYIYIKSRTITVLK